MSPEQFAQKFRRAARSLPANVRAAEKATVADAKKQAVTFSTGPLTTRDLRQAGHPYARRDPTSPTPWKINDQGGPFARSWTTPAPVVTPDGQVSFVVNVDPKSVFMRGTKFEVPRLVCKAVADAIRPIRKPRLAQAVAASLH